MKKIILLISISLLALACNKSQPTKPVNPIPAKTETTLPYLIKFNSIGWLCQYGLCESEVIILDNGQMQKTTFEQESKTNKFTKQTKTSPIDSKDFAVLQNQITNTNFEEILKTKFTETCPAAYDGQQNIFSIYQKGHEYKLDTCAQVIDPEQPPFKLIYQLIYSN